MKQFFWRFAICIVPCILAAFVTIDATMKYRSGDAGGFKLGVDLVGGTILVYEIDLRKNLDTDNKFDPVRDINVLAESLKRRIDPNDLYNITIRPAGGEGRIEIILPTGGTHRAKKAEDRWRELLAELDTAFVPKDSKRKLEVGRGKILELADQIQSIQSDTRWQKELFSTSESWKRLQEKSLEYWALIYNNPEKRAAIASLEIGNFDGIPSRPAGSPNQLGFTKYVLNALNKTQYATTPKTIQNWIKKQAWDETMTQIREKWLVKPWSEKTQYMPGDYAIQGKVVYLSTERSKGVVPSVEPPAKGWYPLNPDGSPLKVEEEPYREDMERIAPDRVDQLTSFVLTKGTIIGQAALSLLDPLVGDNIDRIFEDGPDNKEIRDFIRKLYGPPVQEIMDKINKHMEDKKQGKDLSVEEVQRIKDLVSKVGSLEFRILANSHDDSKAIEDAKKLINDAIKDSEAGNEIAAAQEKGLPPPGPREKEGKEFKAKKYEIITARGAKSIVTYSWVELGPEERRSLNLDNSARTDGARNSAWHEARRRRNTAAQLPEIAGSTERFMLQGSLFYSRECKDRNLPEEERRKKEIEYFILTRDPEFEPANPTIRTRKIDGSFLQNAYGAPGQDMRPTVHFVFNNEGGELFGTITRKNVSEGTGPENTRKYRHLAVILDSMVMSAPTINSEIRTSGQISSPTFTQKQVDAQVNILRAGRLPATLKPQPVSESTIGATLGADTIQQGVRAIGLAFAAVLAFMLVYYRFAGVVASIALMANLLLTVGFMVAVQATFTLSGLAGIVLTLGMAVDANVLIYERLREERERGASLLQAIRNGYDRALPTIIDTHLSSIFTAIVLYVVGNDNLKGFAVSMTVGLVISLFTSLYMTRVMFDFWQSKGWLSKLTMMRLFAKPDIDFMSIRYVVFGATLAVSILGVALFIGRLPNDLNIDFQGGTAYGGKLIKGVTAATIRELVSETHQREVLKNVEVKQIDNEGRRYNLWFPNGDGKGRDKQKEEWHAVSLNNIPEGTPEERLALIKKRASLLSEPSVDLLYHGGDSDEIRAEINSGFSRNFMVRTTEKEPELVQTCLDQLLREGDVQLLKKVYALADNKGKLDEQREIRFRFYDEKPPANAKAEDKKTEEEKKAEKPASASQSFVKSLLNRELRRAFELTDDKAQLPFLFEVVPEGKDDAEGKYGVLKISFGQELKDEDVAKVEKGIQTTVEAFARRPLPDRLENFDSALATETRLRALWAILASWAAIALYLWFRFGNWTFGLAAVLCLIHDLFFTLGAIAACYFVHGTFVGDLLMLDDFKLDLASVAALLTLVGYSVNDTIVVFDRIREVRGKNPDLTPKMINDSINQTLSRTVLASLTVWLVVVVLYFFGGPGVHLFAFVMVIGVIVGTFSSIYVASPLLLLFGEGRHDEGHLQGATPLPEGAFKANA